MKSLGKKSPSMGGKIGKASTGMKIKGFGAKLGKMGGKTQLAGPHK